MSYFTLGRESGVAPERICNPNLSAGGVDLDVATCWLPVIVPRRAPSNQTAPRALDLEHIMNYVHGLFLSSGEWEIMVRALVEEAATLASLALFLGMIAIWAQVIATL